MAGSLRAFPITSEPQVAYFGEVVPGARTIGLAAALVWRGVPTMKARHGGGGPLGSLRGVRHRLWLELGPLGVEMSVAGRPLFARRGVPIRSVNGVGAFAPGEEMAYLDDRPRRMRDEAIAFFEDGPGVLRVLGRVVHAPQGRTLVALVDATGERAASPRLTLRVVSASEIPMPRVDEPVSVVGRTVSYFGGGEHPPWTQALRADPVVRAFMDSGW